jgi:hypothetical protein
MFAHYQDQPVIATKSITKLPTAVTTAVLDNTQEMDKEDNKTLDADLLLKTVINKDKFNLDNNNALHAKGARLDTNLSVTNAKDQDQLVIAISNTIPPPIFVTTAHPTNFLETMPTMLVESTNKMEDAQSMVKTVMPKVKSNLDNNNAMLAKPVLELTKSSLETDALPELLANATNNTTPLPTPVPTAQLVHSLTPTLDNVKE